MGSIALGFPPVGAGPKSPVGNQVYEQTAFGGAWTFPDRSTVPAPFGLLAQDCRYQLGGSVGTRYGWGAAFTLSSENTSNTAFSMFNWLSELGNYLVWFQSSTGGGATRGLRVAKVSDNPPTASLLAAVGVATNAVSYAVAGPRLYYIPWATNTIGEISPTTNASVVSYSAGFHVDAIIPGPPSTAVSAAGVQIPLTAPTEPSGGIVTAGLHNLGLRMQHRSGFLGRPGPDSSTSANPTVGTFTPIAFTSSGSKNLQWAFTPVGTWPADVSQVQVVMSPVSSPNRLFLVPGAVATVVGGASTPVSITINIDDATLVASAAQLECTNSLDWYTASATGLALMQVSAVAQIGNRMFYVSSQADPNGNNFSVVYVSDPYNYQQITKDQHVLQLPGQLKITQCFGVQGSVYLAGPHWTYVTQDNGQVPANWSQPVIVDGRKGAFFPTCVEVETSGRYAWIADRTGLYYFDGSYATRPISDRQKDIWAKLNLSAYEMTVKDDPLQHRVFVHTRIINGPNPPVLMMWDYTAGLGPDQANFSQQATSDSNTGSIEMVQNDLNATVSNILKNKELWFSPVTVSALAGTVSAATNASPTVLTTNTQTLQTGDQVTFSGATGNWTPLNSTFTWTAISNTSGSIPLNATTFGGLTGSVSWSASPGRATFTRELNPLGGDTNVYRDFSVFGTGAAAIHMIYETCIMPGQQGVFNAISHVGTKMRVTGNKAFQPKVFSYDKSTSILLRPSISDLSTNPDGRQNFLGYMVAQNGCIYHFEQNIIDGNVLISEVDMVYGTFGSVL